MAALIESALANSPPPPGAEIDEEHLALLAAGRLDELTADERDRLLRQVATTPWAAELLCHLQDAGLGEIEREADDAAGDADEHNFRLAAAAADREADAAPTGLRLTTTTMRITRAFWAAAACVTIGLAVWRFADPTPTQPTKLATVSDTSDPERTPGASTDKKGSPKISVGTASVENGKANGKSKDAQGKREKSAAPDKAPAKHAEAPRPRDGSSDTQATRAEGITRYTVRDYALIPVACVCLLLTIPVAYWSLRRGRQA